MAEFGWAYVGDGNGVTDVPGPSGSVLLKRDQQRLTGSSALIFNTGSNVLEVDGDVAHLLISLLLISMEMVLTSQVYHTQTVL